MTGVPAARTSRGCWRALDCAGVRSADHASSLAASLVFLVELIVRGSLRPTLDFFQQPFRPGWTTIVLFSLLLIGFDALFGRRHNGMLFVAPIALLLAFIGHQKSLYLGDPLYPTDFLYSRQIVELMPLLVRERPVTAAIIAVGGVGRPVRCSSSLWRYWRRRFPPIRWRMRARAAGARRCRRSPSSCRSWTTRPSRGRATGCRSSR